MRVTPKRIFIFTGVLLAVAGLVALRILTASGAFATARRQDIAGCTSFALPGSAADLEMDRSSGIVYLSVLDRRALDGNALVTGTILKLDLNDPGAQALPATTGDPPGFRPAGLSLWAHPNGPRRLFVVNHAVDADGAEGRSVEVFEEEEDDHLFHYRKTVLDPAFVNPDDVAAVGPDQFYLTNHGGAGNVLTRAVETVIRPGWSDVLYYDGTKSSVAVSGRSFAGGVTVSADGLRLYLAEAGAKQLLIFDRDTETGSLYWSSLIEVAGAPDKLDIGEDGALWAAVEPNTWARERSLSSTTPAPTVILKFAAPVNGFSKAQTIYSNAGGDFSGGSAAVAHKNQLIIGSVTEKRLLRCPLPNPPG
ncbi:MAG TPA: hypothetical protein VE046_18065 [Steroidobacteraceae bacterium]|nr:hypothetical protein [Steroidobacteraceae bacterium]